MLPLVLLCAAGVYYDCRYESGSLVVVVACDGCAVGVCGGAGLEVVQHEGYVEAWGAVAGDPVCVDGQEAQHTSHRLAGTLSHVYMSNPAVVGNHNPSFLLRRSDVTVYEDSGAFLDGEQYVTDIDDNNGFQQNVRFKVTNDDNLLFDTQPHIIGCSTMKCAGTLGTPIGTGTLFFSVAPNQYGRARVEVIAVDDGYEQPVCDGPPLDMMGNKCVPVPCDPSLCTHSDPQYFWIEVIATNDLPSFDHKGDVTSPEDQPTCHDTWATGITPGPGENFGQPQYQPLEWSITTAQVGLFTTQPYILYSQGDTTASLCYEPAPNKVGIARVAITLTDQGNPPLSFPTQYVSITITEVNDAPSFRALTSNVIVLEDNGPYDEVWARDMMPGPQEEVDAGQQLGTFVLTFENPAQSGLFAAQPRVDVATGNLQFTPLQDANTFDQPVNIKVWLEDKVVAPSAPLLSQEVLLVISITPVNDPPSYLPGGPIEVWEDEPFTHPVAWALSMCIGGTVQTGCVNAEADKNGEGQEFVFTVKPTSGDISIFSTFPDFDATGHVQFATYPHKVGETTFDVTLTDTGPVPNMGPTHQLTIRILPVNDPPTFDLVTQRVQVYEDSGVNKVSPFLVNITKGPFEPDEAAQNITCAVEVDNSGLFHPLGGQPRVVLSLGDTIGELVLKPALHAKGSTEARVRCQDTGGAGRGGWYEKVSDTFLISVIGVNDPPSFRLPPAVIVQEDSAPLGHVIPAVATNITAGQEEDGAEYVEFEVTAYDTRLFAAVPQLSPAGTLSFTLLPDVNGKASVHVVAVDRLKTNDTSSVFTGLRSEVSLLNITVVPANDPPNVVLEDDAEQRLRVPVCYEPTGCVRTVKDVFSEISVGPFNEAETQELSVTVTVPLEAQQYVSSANLSGSTEWYAYPAAYGGKDLVFGLAAASADDILPSGLKLVVVVADGQDEGNTTVKSVPFSLYHPWVPPDYPTQLAISLQPTVDGDRVVAEFTLQDGMQAVHPDAAQLSVVTYNMVTAGRERFMDVKADTAQGVYPVSADGVPPGVYYLKATATLSNGAVLTAESIVFTIANQLVTPVARRNASVVTSFNEFTLRNEDVYVDLVLSEGGWNTSSLVDVACSVYQYNGAVPCDGTLVQGDTIRVTVYQNEGLNITEDSTLEVRLPLNLLNDNSNAYNRVITVPVHVSPVVSIKGSMVYASSIRQGEVVFSIGAAGATWVDSAASVVGDAFATTYGGGNGYTDRLGLLSVVRESEYLLKAVLGPDPLYNPTAAETLYLDAESLAPALSTLSIPPEIRANNFSIAIGGGSVGSTQQCRSGGRPWMLAALVLSILCTMLCLVTSPCASLPVATNPVLAAIMATGFEVACDGTLSRVQDGVEWVIYWGVSPAYLAVLAVAIALLHFAVVCGHTALTGSSLRESSVMMLFPNLSLTPFVYLSLGVLFHAVEDAEPAPIAAATICTCTGVAAWIYGTEKAVKGNNAVLVEMTRDTKLWCKREWVGDHVKQWGCVFQSTFEDYLRWAYAEFLLLATVVVLCGAGGAEVPRLVLIAVCCFVHAVGCSVVGVRVWRGEAVLVAVCDVLLMMAAVVLAHLYATDAVGKPWQSEVAAGVLLTYLAVHCVLCVACLANKWSMAQHGHHKEAPLPPAHVTSNPIVSTFEPPPPLSTRAKYQETATEIDTSTGTACPYCGTAMLGAYCYVCGAK